MGLSEPEGLLRIAIADLETAWGFWLQQAVEKSLKAWLLHLGSDPPLTHDLHLLLLLLEAGVATGNGTEDADIDHVETLLPVATMEPQGAEHLFGPWAGAGHRGSDLDAISAGRVSVLHRGQVLPSALDGALCGPPATLKLHRFRVDREVCRSRTCGGHC